MDGSRKVRSTKRLPTVVEAGMILWCGEIYEDETSNMHLCNGSLQHYINIYYFVINKYNRNPNSNGTY